MHLVLANNVLLSCYISNISSNRWAKHAQRLSYRQLAAINYSIIRGLGLPWSRRAQCINFFVFSWMNLNLCCSIYINEVIDIYEAPASLPLGFELRLRHIATHGLDLAGFRTRFVREGGARSLVLHSHRDAVLNFSVGTWLNSRIPRLRIPL